MTTTYMGYILIMYMHRVPACERACASTHMVKHSLFYERILFKFDVNRLQITTSSMEYVFLMFTHCVHA
jgi:hypothetical protein